MLKDIAPLVVTILAAVGCASSGNERFAAEMNALIGKADKAYFANRYGPPTKQAMLDSRTEMWEYRLNEQRFTSTTGYNFATYRFMRLTFEDGVLKQWRSEFRSGD